MIDSATGNDASEASGTPPGPVDSDMFRVMADWYHSAILVLAASGGIDAEPQSIARAFGISPAEANLAINRLVALGLLRRDSGGLAATNRDFVLADPTLTTPAQKKHQRQILEKAMLSLDGDPFERRIMSGMAMAIDPAKLPQARAMIQNFLHTLCAFLESGTGGRVYQMGVQLYPLQRAGV